MAIDKSINRIDVNTASYDKKTTVVGQPDIPDLNTEAMQESVEYMPRNLIVPKVNEVVDAVNGTYSKAETDNAIASKIVEIGAGDMAKAVYDPPVGGVNPVRAAGGIAEYVKPLGNAIETMSAFSVIVKSTDWQGASAPFTQMITVDTDGRSLSWITETDKCDIPVGDPTHNLGSDWNNDLYLQFIEDYSKIKCVRTANGGLIFVCPEEKTVWGELKIDIKMLNRR